MKATVLEKGRIGFKRFLPEWLLACVPELTRTSPQAEPLSSCGKRVLIVDDDAVVRLVTSRVLRNKGYEVVTAADCSEAIGAVAEGRPDVVLLDLNFPPDIACGGGISWDGLRLMFWLRGLRNARGARFIIITSSDSKECREKALAAGVAGFFQKPIDHKDLLDTIERELKASSGETVPAPRVQFEI